MDYTLIRPLIYRKRKSLEEFGVLDEAKNTIVNAFFYDRLLKISYLHPRHDYANEEMLRIFNDVHYFMTLFFHDENPLAHYADYRKIPNPGQHKDEISYNRTWVELSMTYVILQRWYRTNWFRQKLEHSKFFEILKGEIEDYMEMPTDTGDIASIITEGCEIRDFIMTIDYNFPLRNIQEVIDGKESLKDCLGVGKGIRDVVNRLCKDDEQKLGLIARLLEPEEEGYGAFSTPIPDAYRSLHELRSELTGEPLPAKLPFERFELSGRPMMGTPPELLKHEDKRDATANSQIHLQELENKVKELQKEKKLLKQVIEQKLNDALEKIQKLEKEAKELQLQGATSYSATTVEAMTIELFTYLFKDNVEETARAFYNDILGKRDPEIAEIVVAYEDKFRPRVGNRDIYRPMHAAKIYQGIDRNFDTALRKLGFRVPK